MQNTKIEQCRDELSMIGVTIFNSDIKNLRLLIECGFDIGGV